MVISGGILVISTVAGRLTSRVQVRLLIGSGLIVIGAGLLLMRGLDAGSAWTHLVPGMIVGGVGVGVVNPPLASTAVGVVASQRAGMASGINSTFRQVGVATGIALLGTLSSNNVKDEVTARLPRCPDCPQRPAVRYSGAIRGARERDCPTARACQAARGNDHPGSFHHRPEPYSAGCGSHRAGVGVASLAAIRGRDFAQQQRPGSRD
ncbi:MAG TPA: hypothetical protein VFB06_00095 [Streptosporangiaceae bacterium]|nr:hypothetical protein [Streptosporangiaceae bacterium]